MVPLQPRTNVVTSGGHDLANVTASSISEPSESNVTVRSQDDSHELSTTTEVVPEVPVEDKVENVTPDQKERVELIVDAVPSESVDKLAVPKKATVPARTRPVSFVATKTTGPPTKTPVTPKPASSTRATPSTGSVRGASHPPTGTVPSVRVLKPQNTGGSVVSTSSQAKTATPLRTQKASPKITSASPTTRTTSSAAASSLRMNSSTVTTPRTPRSPLTAPTASSLAKTRTSPVTGTETPRARTSTVTKTTLATKPSAGPGTTTTRPASKAGPTSVKSTKVDESVPFPSIRKTTSKRNSVLPGNEVRRPRASLPGGGPSAAALAARAKVGVKAPPVPSVPTDVAADLPPASPATEIVVAESSTTMTTPEVVTLDQPLPEIVPPIQNGLRADTVDDDDDDALVIPPADPLTAEALKDHDAKQDKVELKGTQLDEAVAMLEFGGGGVSDPALDVERTELKVAVLDGEPQKLGDDKAAIDPIKVEIEGPDQVTGDLDEPVAASE